MASLASEGREVILKVSLKDRKEVPTVLWAGEEQVEEQDSWVCPRDREKAGGDGPQWKPVDEAWALKAWRTLGKELGSYSERGRQLQWVVEQGNAMFTVPLRAWNEAGESGSALSHEELCQLLGLCDQ